MPVLSSLRSAWLLLLLFLLLSGHASPADRGDLDEDRDGLPDAFEQAILERFAPRVFVSEAECDILPSRFAPDSPEPLVAEKDGTIYAQVFPLKAPEGSARIELHYYHLWARDCGRFGHELDAEHVSVLLEADADSEDPSAWSARYWYAAAHEDTVCDVSHGAHASALNAVHQGAGIWISLGKHASYLSQKRCKLGCGGDTCKKMRQVSPLRLVNIGEPGHPRNGAIWTASAQWPLAEKMASDFSPEVIAQLERANPKKIVAINSGVPPVRATILAGGETLDGTATGKRHTGDALKTGKKATGNALGKAFRAVGGFLGGGKQPGTQASTAETKDTP